jgi:hypothetical protein
LGKATLAILWVGAGRSLNKFTSTAIQVIEVWRQLDPKHNRLVKLKTEVAAKQLRKEIQAETRQIRFRNRGNPNSGILPGEIASIQSAEHRYAD